LCMYINKKDKLIEIFADFGYIQNYYWCRLVWSLSSPCFSIHVIGVHLMLIDGTIGILPIYFTITLGYICQILVMCVLLISVEPRSDWRSHVIWLFRRHCGSFKEYGLGDIWFVM
jgi:hypothetical protein